METFGKFCAHLGLLSASAILDGWIFSYLWLWFVVSLFCLPELSIGHAIGFSFLCRYLTADLDTVLEQLDKERDKNRDFADIAKRLITKNILRLFLFGLAWVIHSLI